METLPQDLFDQIVFSVLPEAAQPTEPYEKRAKLGLQLAPLAALSRRWQAAVERVTFKSIAINSNDLPDFIRIFTPERRHILSNLNFTALLPSYNAEAALRAESPAERAANDESYTQATLLLFQTLKSWEEDDPRTIEYNFNLAINYPESPSDRPWPSTVAPWSRGEGNPNVCIHEGRYLHSYIDFLRPDELPELERVDKIAMVRPGQRYGFRNIYPKVHVLLASKMPNLEFLVLNMHDDEHRFPEIRKRNRDELAGYLKELSLPRLKTADLELWTQGHRNEAAVPALLHEPGFADPLSSSIHEISHNLVILAITGVLDPTVLKPMQGLRDTPWPNLRFLDIDFHATTPSGDWYFKGGEDFSVTAPRRPEPRNGPLHLHEEDFDFISEAEFAYMTPVDVFRGAVNEDTLVPFIDAYVEALAVMPKLTSSVLNCQLKFESPIDGEPSWFSIAYFAPCGSAPKHPPRLICPNCNRGVTRQLVTSLMGWTPSEELGAKLRAIQDEFQEAPMVEKDISEFIKEHEV